MNYKEKYDKVIKKIQSLLDNAKNNRHIIVRVEDIEKTFPELKESEDERIRKELICFLNAEIPQCEARDKFIAWLEKHGGNLVENGYTNNKDFIKYADKYSHEIWHKLMDNFKNIKDYHIGCNDVSDIVLNAIIDTCNWLEKQGMSYTKRDVDDAYLKGVTSTKNEIEKQYEANYQIRKDIATFIFNYKGDIKDRAKWMNYLGIKVSFAEKQGEQKSDSFCREHCKGFQDTGKCFADGDCKAKREAESIDKVEPKFKVGDFITDGNSVLHITNMDYGFYQFEDSYDAISIIDEKYHLWTIQDAKDGDVLASDNSIFIFREEYIAEKPIAYCGLMNGLFIEGENACWTNENCNPATKEQRGTLFAKMREAGYEWDADRKELRKIKSKFHEGEWVTNGIETVQITGYDIDYGYQVDYKGNLQHRDTDVIEKEYHLWTIRDAKGGDVLVDVYGNIGIFEKRYGINWHTYCYVGYEGRFIHEGGSHGSICYPATKEQREQLEKAMADAGYIFDFDWKLLYFQKERI